MNTYLVAEDFIPWAYSNTVVYTSSCPYKTNVLYNVYNLYMSKTYAYLTAHIWPWTICTLPYCTHSDCKDHRPQLWKNQGILFTVATVFSLAHNILYCSCNITQHRVTLGQCTENINSILNDVWTPQLEINTVNTKNFWSPYRLAAPKTSLTLLSVHLHTLLLFSHCTYLNNAL